MCVRLFFFFFQAEDGIRDYKVTGVQTCALPISSARLPHTRSNPGRRCGASRSGPAYPLPRSPVTTTSPTRTASRSEEHTSELQSPCNLVCRLLLEKKKIVRGHERRQYSVRT